MESTEPSSSCSWIMVVLSTRAVALQAISCYHFTAYYSLQIFWKKSAWSWRFEPKSLLSTLELRDRPLEPERLSSRPPPLGLAVVPSQLRNCTCRGSLFYIVRNAECDRVPDEANKIANTCMPHLLRASVLLMTPMNKRSAVPNTICRV